MVELVVSILSTDDFLLLVLLFGMINRWSFVEIVVV